MLPLGLLALWIGLVAPAPVAAGEGEPPRLLEVAVDRLDVLSEPDDAAFATSRLARGDTVEVRKALADGWLAIAPPAGSFHWVEEAAVEPLRDGRLYIKADKTTLRFGREGDWRPGPLRRTLLEGMVLLPADQPRLTYLEGRRRRSWIAVAAGADEVRFVRSAGVADPKAVAAPRPLPAVAERKASLAEAVRSDLPADLEGALRRIEGDHRAAVTRPIEGWDLAGVRRDYQALLAGRGDAPARAAVREKLDDLDREDEMAKAAREFEALVKTSRRRDAVVLQVKDALRDLRMAEDLAYDAEGLLQATSQRVEGEKVFALLNEEGRVVAYLKIPPGINTTNLVARQVGVRGKSRFDEGLKFRLLDVRDIEPLIPDSSRPGSIVPGEGEDRIGGRGVGHEMADVGFRIALLVEGVGNPPTILLLVAPEPFEPLGDLRVGPGQARGAEGVEDEPRG